MKSSHHCTITHVSASYLLKSDLHHSTLLPYWRKPSTTSTLPWKYCKGCLGIYKCNARREEKLEFNLDEIQRSKTLNYLQRKSRTAGVNKCCIKDQITIQLPGLRNKASLCIVKIPAGNCVLVQLCEVSISASCLPHHKTWYTGQGSSTIWPRWVCPSQLL